jgi:hypothetical protein
MQISFMKQRRVFNVTDWSIEFRHPDTIICKPSGRTFARRLGVTFIFALFAAGAYYVLMQLPQDGFLSRLAFILFAAFVFLGIMAPVSLTWQRLTIRRDPKKLYVDSFFWTPDSLTFMAGNLRSITILASELPSKSGFSAGWRWRVLLFGEHGGIDIWLDRQYDTPEERLAPGRVADFVRYLQHLLPLPYQGPQIVKL